MRALLDLYYDNLVPSQLYKLACYIMHASMHCQAATSTHAVPCCCVAMLVMHQLYGVQIQSQFGPQLGLSMSHAHAEQPSKATFLQLPIHWR